VSAQLRTSLFWVLLQAGLGIEPSRNAFRPAIGFATRGSHQHRHRHSKGNFCGNPSTSQIDFANRSEGFLLMQQSGGDFTNFRRLNSALRFCVINYGLKSVAWSAFGCAINCG
jgi:hypothetical protein